MSFSQFSFFPSHRGRFILHCPLSFIRLLLTAFSFWRIYSHPSFSDVALPLTQRREFAKRGFWRAIGARAHLMHFLSLWKNSYHKCGSLFRNFILEATLGSTWQLEHVLISAKPLDLFFLPWHTNLAIAYEMHFWGTRKDLYQKFGALFINFTLQAMLGRT